MKTVINIKTDRDTKETAKKVAGELGLTLSAVINVYLRQFIRTREFNFSLAYTMTPELEKVIEEAEKDLATGENISPEFSTAEEAISWLRKEAGK